MNELPYPVVDEVGNVICQVCGQSFKFITTTHLKKHNLTVPEYTEAFPGIILNYKTYMAAVHNSSSLLFKKDEELSKKQPGRHKKPEVSEPEIIDKPPDYPKHVDKGKVKILQYLYKNFRNIENNYQIVKLRLDGNPEYIYITDMADPVRKVLFNFPNAFWHNFDCFPDHRKRKILEADGWMWIDINNKNPVVKDLEDIDDSIIADMDHHINTIF